MYREKCSECSHPNSLVSCKQVVGSDGLLGSMSVFGDGNFFTRLLSFLSFICGVAGEKDGVAKITHRWN